MGRDPASLRGSLPFYLGAYLHPIFSAVGRLPAVRGSLRLT
jgi:hypothetical protein